MEINIPAEAFEEIQREKPKRRRYVGCLILFVIFFLIISGLAYYFRSYIEVVPKLFSVTQQSVPRTQAENNITYKYNGSKYVNILLLGSDNDAKFDPSNVLTQTMIIVSINTQTNQVNMISIPRDSWVPIQGMSGGYGKIDQASGIGGLALARQTVESDYGVHIDYYAWVGLQGFVNVIDTLGGVDIDVNHPVIDDVYPNDINGSNPYSAIRLYIPAGMQHLSGVRALEYVRSRHGDLEGDFGRSARQQQVLLALRSKVKGNDIISELPTLSNELSGSVRTDLTPQELASLSPLMFKVNSTDIHRYILSVPDYGSNAVSTDGQDIVQPDMTKIHTLLNGLFQ